MQSLLSGQGIKNQDDWQEKIMNQPGHNQELRMSIMQEMFITFIYLIKLFV